MFFFSIDLKVGSLFQWVWMSTASSHLFHRTERYRSWQKKSPTNTSESFPSFRRILIVICPTIHMSHLVVHNLIRDFAKSSYTNNPFC